MTQSFDELKKHAISNILSVSGKDKTARVIENHMNNLIEISLIKGAASRQAEIDALQKQIDDALDYVFGLYCTGDLDTERFENILKGESNE